jgi:23S rRNA pseudouridine2605 synthase
MRLNRFLAHAGIASRRKADALIAEGRIQINGTVVEEMGRMVQPEDAVSFDGQPVQAERPVYILLNKPKGFLTTTSDERDRRTVMDLIAAAGTQRVYPVGRLDRQTSGLLLLTNDGALAERLMHPRYEVEKLYAVSLDKPLSERDRAKIEAGLTLEDGRVEVDAVRFPKEDNRREVGLAIHSGRNRIVRRIFEHLGYRVVHLDRVIYAGLTKKDLPRGQWRFLKRQELNALKHLGMGQKPMKGNPGRLGGKEQA